MGAIIAAGLAAKGAIAIRKINSAQKGTKSVSDTGGGTAVVRESYYDGFDAIRGVKSPPRGMEGQGMESEQERRIRFDETMRRVMGKNWESIEDRVNNQLNAQIQSSNKMLEMGNRQMAMSQSFMGMANTTAEMLGDRSLEMTQPISVQANVDRRGLAIAVREGEMEIRTSEFTYT